MLAYNVTIGAFYIAGKFSDFESSG